MNILRLHLLRMWLTFMVTVGWTEQCEYGIIIRSTLNHLFWIYKAKKQPDTVWTKPSCKTVTSDHFHQVLRRSLFRQSNDNSTRDDQKIVSSLSSQKIHYRWQATRPSWSMNFCSLQQFFQMEWLCSAFHLNWERKYTSGVPYSGKFLRDPIFVVFVDDHLTAKLSPRNKIECMVHNGRECTCPWKLNLRKW